MDRLPIIFGDPTPAAIRRATTIDLKTGLPVCRNPAPRWIGHGQQLAARRLAAVRAAMPSLPADRMTRQQARRLARKGRA